MKVRSASELKSLDDELNLFEENDWDFLSVINSYDTNFEYFNDVRDTDFDKSNSSFIREHIFSLLSLIIVLIACIFTAISTSGILDKKEYYDTLNMKSVNSGRDYLNYVDGSEVDSNTLLRISWVLNNYFNCLQAEDDYNSLNEYCSNSSFFANTYYDAVSKVEVLYDKNDCYARSLRKFGGLCRLLKINKIVYKDGVYYCYLNMSLPTKDDMIEYVYLYSYNFTKEFNTYLPTEAGIVKYMLDLMETNQVPCSSVEICLELREKDGTFSIVNDSYIATICVDAYTTVVNQISLILGSNLTIK